MRFLGSADHPRGGIRVHGNIGVYDDAVADLKKVNQYGKYG